jgi:hypothetical protein
VLDTPASGSVSQHPRFDLYRPDDADQPLPVVVFVPGPVPPDLPVRPRHWPVYQGYSRLIVSLAPAPPSSTTPFTL